MFSPDKIRAIYTLQIKNVAESSSQGRSVKCIVQLRTLTYSILLCPTIQTEHRHTAGSYARFSFASSGSDSNTNSFKASNSGSSLAPKSERSIAINTPRDSALRENGSGVKAG